MLRMTGPKKPTSKRVSNQAEQIKKYKKMGH